MGKEKISFNEFIKLSDKLEIKVGLIVEAVRVPKKTKLLELIVAFEDPLVVEGFITKVCVTNLGEIYEPEKFVGSKLPFIMNLEPSKIGGVISEVMLMVSKKNDNEEDIRISMDKFHIGGELM